MVRVHAINDVALAPEQFHVTERLFRETLERRPELRGEVRLTIGRSDEPLDGEAAEAEALLGWTFPADIAERAPHVRWIHVIGAGVEHLQPFDWVPAGAAVTNSSGVHAARAGEFIACSLLMLNNKLPAHLEEQAARRWTPRYSSVIAGKTALFLGVGTIGGEGARRAHELGLRVRGVRRSGEPHPHVDEMLAPGALDEALRDVDFVVVCSALTPQTRGLLGRAQLELLPDHAGVVNVSRGPVVDYEALAELLRAGRLGGAILDVFEPEPLPPESPLWDCPRLVVTPHVSSDPLDYAARMLDLFLDNLARLVAGAPLHNRIPLDRGY